MICLIEAIRAGVVFVAVPDSIEGYALHLKRCALCLLGGRIASICAWLPVGCRRPEPSHFGAIRIASRLRPLFLGIILLVGTVGIAWSNPTLSSDEYSVEVWHSDDGVPGNVVMSFAQSAEGYLWMATEQALARFDGDQFAETQEPSLNPLPIEWDGPLRTAPRLIGNPGESVWLTTNRGDLWRWREEQFERWFQAGSVQGGFSRAIELSSNAVLAVTRGGQFFKGNAFNQREIVPKPLEGRAIPESVYLDAENHAWFVTDQAKVVRMNLASGEVTPLSAMISSSAKGFAVRSDPNRTIWIGTSEGLFEWQRGKLTQLPRPESVAKFDVRKLAVGSDSSVWVGAGEKAWLWRDDQWQGPLGEWSDAVPKRAQLVDSQGNLWIAPPTCGLRCLRPGQSPVQLGPAQGLTADIIALFCDREGDIWASVYRAGIARIREQRFNQVRVSSGLHAVPLWNVAEDREGTIWFAAEFKGPVRWHEGEENGQAETDTGIIPAEWTKALTVDSSGRVATASRGTGIVHFNEGRFQPFLPWPMDADFSRVLYADRSGRWWLGSDTGLFCWWSSSDQSWHRANGLAQDSIRSVIEDHFGRIWVGTFGNGAAWFNGQRFISLRKKEGLVNDDVYTLCASPDGSVWAGTAGGLGRWRAGLLTSYTIENGLPDNRVVQILSDDMGYLWVGTRDGLCRISIASADKVDRRECTSLDCVTFDRDDGLPTRVFQDRASPSCWRARDGRLWFLTAEAAVSCQPNRIHLDTVPPTVTLEDVVIDGTRVNNSKPRKAGRPESLWAGVSRTAPHDIRVPPGNQTVSIRYAGLSLAAPEQVRFEYQLEGLDRSWIKAGTRKEVTYNHLPPGSYRFRVRACNHDGVWNVVPTELGVTLLPRFWQTRLFPGFLFASAAVLLAGSVAWAQQLQLRKQLAQLELQRAREAERTRISRDLHDNLGACLTEISMLAIDGADSATSLARFSDQFRRIKEKAESVTDELDSLVWAIDPRHDTIRSLAGYLGGYVEQFSRSAGLDCRIQIDRNLPDREVGSEFRHHVFLATKEAVHNAVRHGKPVTIEFEFLMSAEGLQINVTDDGCGFDPSVAANGHGLENLKQRLASVGGQCTIISRPGSGSQVTFTIPNQKLK